MASKGITLPITYKADLTGLQQAEKGLANFGKMAAGIGAAAVGAITAIGVKGVQSFAEFDSQLNKSVAIMGDVSDVMRGEMSDAAREVAKTTTFSAAEAAESYFFLASAGLDAEASIAALPAVANFAQAGMFDMALATDLLTDAQSALGLSSDDASENLENLTSLADVLVKANTLANASVEQFSSALTNKAAASMRTLSIDMEEGIAVLAVFADQGLKGEAAGTAFNATLEGLTRTARINAGAYAALGVEVFDSAGEMNNMADIVAQLEVGMDGMSTEQQNAALAGLGLTRQALDGTKALLGNSEAVREYEAELRNAGGTVDEVAGKQLETFSGQLALLQSGFEDTFLSIGALIVPILLDLMTDLGPVLEIFSGALIEVFQELVPVITSLAEAFAPLAQVIASNVGVIGDIARIFGEVLVAVMPTVTSLLDMIAYVLGEVLAAAQPIIDKILPIMVGLFEELMPVLWDLIDGALLPLIMIAFEIFEAFLPIIEKILPIVMDLIKTLAPVVIELVQAFLPFIQMILPILIGLLEFLMPILEFVADLIGIVLVGAIGFFVAAFEKVQAFFEKFGPVFENIFIGFQIVFATVINGIIAGFEGFINFFIRGFNLIIRGINAFRREAGQTEFELAAEVQFGRLEVPKLKPMAIGGIVTGPTAALIGEAGPEAVIPLSKLGNMGGNTYNVTINANVADSRLGEVVVNAIKRYERSSGKVFASA
jgi:TP901 family phage tail tape measure protein